MKKLYCYRVSPIDYWGGAQTGAQLLASVWQSFGLHSPDRWFHLAHFCRAMHRLESEALKAFRKLAWEGDGAGGVDSPSYFAVPGDVELSIGYMVKQGNNGTCFVASPVPLPSLGGFDDEVLEVEIEDNEPILPRFNIARRPSAVRTFERGPQCGACGSDDTRSSGPRGGVFFIVCQGCKTEWVVRPSVEDHPENCNCELCR